MSSGAVGCSDRGECCSRRINGVCQLYCGIAQVDDIKLEGCDGCQSVSYCSDICQGNHREQHKEGCKRIAAELHDRNLFEQPEESHLGECPICFFPLSLDMAKSCDGCCYAGYISDGGYNCPFCREPHVDNDEEHNNKMVMKRVEANDPNALCRIGGLRYHEGDYLAAFL